ncbi:MAG: NTPase [Candidatus Korarchaeota archaeon]
MSALKSQKIEEHKDKKPKNFIVTGRPGSGKSTIVMTVAEEMRRRGFVIRGIATPEVRVKGIRVGFLVRAIDTGEEAIFASIRYNTPQKIGKYGVDIRIFEKVAIPALERAFDGDIIIVDEIGKMELLSNTFVKLIYRALDCQKIVVATMGKGIAHPLESLVRRRKDTKVFFAEPGLAEEIIKNITSYLTS